MFVQIQTVDGQFFASDPVELVDTGMTVQEWDQSLNEVENLLCNFREMDYLSLDIGGRKKFFNPANILWAEVILS